MAIQISGVHDFFISERKFIHLTILNHLNSK